MAPRGRRSGIPKCCARAHIYPYLLCALPWESEWDAVPAGTRSGSILVRKTCGGEQKGSLMKELVREPKKGEPEQQRIRGRYWHNLTFFFFFALKGTAECS